MNYLEEMPSSGLLNLGTAERDWQRTIVAALEPLDARLLALADEFRSMLDAGNVQLAQFAIDAAPAVAWVLHTNRWVDFTMLDRLFAHPSVNAALSATHDPNAKASSFERVGPFEGLGRLADHIVAGGPYVEFRGSDSDALGLALDFMDAVCDRRFSETLTFFTRNAWTDWFSALGLDASFLWFDKRSGIITVLLLTGAD